MTDYSSVKYFIEDYPRTLFPLDTTRVLVQNQAEAILKYTYEKVLNQLEPEHSFLPQLHCYAAKTGFHLRRTVKLDPVAELFIYDLVYRNRKTSALISEPLGRALDIDLEMDGLLLKTKVIQISRCLLHKPKTTIILVQRLT